MGDRRLCILERRLCIGDRWLRIALEGGLRILNCRLGKGFNHLNARLRKGINHLSGLRIGDRRLHGLESGLHILYCRRCMGDRRLWIVECRLGIGNRRLRILDSRLRIGDRWLRLGLEGRLCRLEACGKRCCHCKSHDCGLGRLQWDSHYERSQIAGLSLEPKWLEPKWLRMTKNRKTETTQTPQIIYWWMAGLPIRRALAQGVSDHRPLELL